MGGNGEIPVLQLGDVLLVTIQTELHDRLALRLQEALTERVHRTGARGVVIDISAVEIVDSFLARVLHDVAAATTALAARTIVAGMRPEVAITLTELGLPLRGLRTALDVDRAFRLLHEPGGGAPERA
ncbi:rsbT antagonist protein RsbS [Amycolatopsis arida]|uniref:RsbT antagonist protein RsbS n=1 Tax=Amycolatopsis arida TaxID=587909 RepID=A0A1I5V8D8_9PSEU|nr:STAS domain-containing protein [Amycolatopsis arida]TDX91185.1 rsbT antagonist protein RsbS [Amycolatopsis arida]SFQ03700.1 rsbT antagonist protein RsbS [Amycolatopsis arida]